MWRTTPIYRDEVEGDLAEDVPPGTPAAIGGSEVQQVTDGAGFLFRRRYRTRIREAGCSAIELVALVAADPDAAAPSEFATFQKLSGEAGAMRVGDEYVVRMAGPWDGPVGVAECDPAKFRLVTLEGHLEAGQIEFRARDEGDEVVFEIESWARSKDRLTDFLYDRLRISKEVQLHMWTSTLERVVGLSGGRMVGGIEIHTRKLDMERSQVSS